MRRGIALSMLLLIAVSNFALSQMKRELKGEVVTAQSGERIEYHALVTVRLKGHGVKTQTNSDGEFRLGLKDELKAGIEVTLEVDKPGYAIYRPYKGQWTLLQDSTKLVTLQILPLGHALFKSPEEIEKWAEEIQEKAKEQVGKEGEPQKLDLSRYIKEWAVQYGFKPEEAQAEIEAWIKEVEKNKDPSKQAKAEFLKGNFTLADSLYGEAEALRKARRERIRKKQQALAAEEEEATKEIIEVLRARGDSRYQDYRFDDALHAYEQALAEVDRKQFEQLWASVQIDIGLAHWQLGIRVEGERIANHLSSAVEAYRQALTVYTREQLPQDWAMTQNNLGNVLSDLGTRTGGEEGAKWLAQAVTAYENALEVRTRAQLPQDWAATQNNLGLVYNDLGTRTGGEEGAKWLAQAVTAYDVAGLYAGAIAATMGCHAK